MATWNSRGLRGSTLEDLINRTNDQYREKKLALIQKIPTPITPINIDKESRHITLAFFDQKSTVDYIGSITVTPAESLVTPAATPQTSPAVTVAMLVSSILYSTPELVGVVTFEGTVS